MRWRQYFVCCLLLVFVGFSSATIEVFDSSLQEEYFPGEVISGFVNISIEDEASNATISPDPQASLEISLLKLLEDNFVDFTCSTPHCGKSFASQGSGNEDIILNLIEGEIGEAGIEVFGNDVKVNGIDFGISSDFSSSDVQPLELTFFEGSTWKFNEFSDEDFSETFYGTYQTDEGEANLLIKQSTYCQEVTTLTGTGAIFAGALVDDGDTKDLRMEIFELDGATAVDTCQFNPSQDEEGCILESGEGEIFEQGSYYLCVSALNPTDYSLFTESEGENSGFLFSNGPANQLVDYGIFHKTAQYRDAGFLDSSTLNFNELSNLADDYIQEAYGGDCSSGCILPLQAKGIAQDLNFSHLTLDYQDQVGDKQTKDFVNVESEVALLSYSGELDLSVTNFEVSTDGAYSLYLNGESFFETTLKFLDAPKIISITPKIFPAGVFSEITAIISFSGNLDDLTYTWFFWGRGLC